MDFSAFSLMVGAFGLHAAHAIVTAIADATWTICEFVRR
jgi:hypothetical protein